MISLNTREQALLAWLRGKPSYLDSAGLFEDYRVGDWVLAVCFPNIGRKTLNSLKDLGLIEEDYPGSGRYRLVRSPPGLLPEDWTHDFGDLWVA